MIEHRLLTPDEAEAVVSERIEKFGLGALPAVHVVAIAEDVWRVGWDHQQRDVAPMSRTAWESWLTTNVGSLDAGDLQTTES